MTASLPLDLDALFALQRQAFAAQSFPPEVVRRDRLDRLRPPYGKLADSVIRTLRRLL